MLAKGWLLALTKQEALINKENYKSWLFGQQSVFCFYEVRR